MESDLRPFPNILTNEEYFCFRTIVSAPLSGTSSASIVSRTYICAYKSELVTVGGIYFALGESRDWGGMIVCNGKCHHRNLASYAARFVAVVCRERDWKESFQIDRLSINRKRSLFKWVGN